MTAFFDRSHRAVHVPLAIGVVAGVLTLVTAAADPRRALLGWIAAYSFAVATVIAAMLLVMILDLTSARWWLVLRDVFLGLVGTTPLLVPGFVPIAIGYARVYPWAAPRSEFSRQTAEILDHQSAWNRPSWFFVRSAIYLAIWVVFAQLLRRADTRRASDPVGAAGQERLVGAIGIPTLSFALTYAAFDWVMALQPGYTSTIFGIYVFTSGLLTALAAVAVAIAIAERAGSLPGLAPDHVHAVGRLTLMALVLWAYIAFFQLVLIWIADIPRESSFYIARSRGVWSVVNGILVFGRFALSFVALLSRPLKRSARALAAVGGWLLVTSVIEFVWFALPAFGTTFAPVTLLPFVTVLGLFWAYAAHLLLRHREKESLERAIVDPSLEESLRYRSP